MWRYRELLVGLVRKELKVKYKDSSLGFFWSMLNPAMYLAVFYVVFQVILGSGIPYFAIYLLSGLLAWNLFSASLTAATGSIVNNGVARQQGVLPARDPAAGHGRRQPRALLPAGARAPRGTLVVFRYGVDLEYLWLVLPALLVLLLLDVGAGHPLRRRSTSTPATSSTCSSSPCWRGSG